MDIIVLYINYYMYSVTMIKRLFKHTKLHVHWNKLMM